MRKALIAVVVGTLGFLAVGVAFAAGTPEIDAVSGNFTLGRGNFPSPVTCTGTDGDTYETDTYVFAGHLNDTSSGNELVSLEGHLRISFTLTRNLTTNQAVATGLLILSNHTAGLKVRAPLTAVFHYQTDMGGPGRAGIVAPIVVNGTSVGTLAVSLQLVIDGNAPRLAGSFGGSSTVDNMGAEWNGDTC